ncbi:MORN repeat-containing protein, putative [Eimeria maxima]|uniref:MORN repeat-containing protein, putative n=1 Tax=Eimeria maxima TaxID=5804 RepID=U6M929_EIMMA|nr:MORN repeat-containing protein, putative [Eimeria maxima]CDJ58175.1 MORN repeat-containing protein, putative [Eimeria maxima]
MLPADSVFAIGGEDESEAEEDLLAEGTRRLGAIAANVSPTEGASSSREGTTGTDAPETLSCVTVPPVSPAHPFEFGSSPAAGVLHSQEGTRRFLESYHCGVGSSGRGTPSLCSTGGGHEQAGRVAERGSDSSNSSSRISAVHRTSAVDGNTSVYRPEVDGPPIVGVPCGEGNLRPGGRGKFRVMAAFFELMEGAASGSPGRFSPSALPTKVLVQLYDQLNTVNFHLMRYTEITFNLEAGLPPFIMAVTPGQLLVLVKALLLEKKILFYSSDASRASTAVLSFISLLPVDIDAMTVEVKNTSLDALLRLTVWEQQFARRIVKETSFSSIGTEEQSPSYGSSTSISRHATDLLQQTIASLASHAAAHGLHFLRSKEEGTTSELHGFHASGAATLAADLEQHRRRAASAISPRDNRRHSNSSRSLGRGKQTVPLGGSRHRETEERKRYDDNSTSAERQTLTGAASSVGRNSRYPCAPGAFHVEVVAPSVISIPAVVSVEWPSGQGGLPGIARFQEESRTSSDAMRPPSVVDLNWEAQADLIRAEFAQHLEQLCRRAAVAAGRERSRQLLLHHLSSTTADDGENLRAFGVEYDGSWVNDERHGHGVLDHEPMGYLYVGQWQHNKKSGEGHLYSRKERYWGNFVDNKYHGRGRYVQRDGLEYEGEFARGRFEGLGKLSLSRDEGINTSGDCRKGVVIRGSFEGGKVTGVVNAVYADGKTYTGELSPETLLPEGGGSMLYRDSCLYDGQWRSGMRHGAGVLTIPVGVVGRTSVSNGGSEHEAVIVDGQWQDDMPDPDAEWSVTFPTGDKYLGQLKFPSVCSTTGREAGKDQSVGQTEALARIVPHGWGLSKRKDTGEVYEGQWRCGMRHGNGVPVPVGVHYAKWRKTFR